MVLNERGAVLEAAPRGHAVEARREIGRQAPAMPRRPFAAVAIGVRRRCVERPGQILRLVHQRRHVAVAIDLQGPALRCRTRVEGNLVARRPGHRVGVGIDLRYRGILARRLVPVREMPGIAGMHRQRMPLHDIHRPELRHPVDAGVLLLIVRRGLRYFTETLEKRGR